MVQGDDYSFTIAKSHVHVSCSHLLPSAVPQCHIVLHLLQRETHMGSGSAYVPDYGQFGGDPCTNASVVGSWGGAFRAQLPLNKSWDGKLLQINPATSPITVNVVATGLHNPWRFAFIGNNAYVVDTGSGATNASYVAYEEVNGPVNVASIGPTPVNFGFPCYGNGMAQPDYVNLPNLTLCNGIANTLPLYSYNKATFSGYAASISALGAYNNRIFIGDYSLGRIWSINTGGGDVKTHLATGGPTPVDIAEVSGRE